MIIFVIEQQETQVNALGRKIQLIEEDLERCEEKLKNATTKLAQALHLGDESER